MKVSLGLVDDQQAASHSEDHRAGWRTDIALGFDVSRRGCHPAARLGTRDQLVYRGPTAEPLRIAAAEDARLLLIGGVPLGEPIVMWWNFVARTKEGMVEARSAWEAGDDRFGPVESELGRIAAPPPLWDRPGMQPIRN